METLSLLSQHLKDLGPGSNVMYTITGPRRSVPFAEDNIHELEARKVAVSALLQRAWLTRLWVWQELILPIQTRVVVACGGLRMPFHQFWGAIMMILGVFKDGDLMRDCFDQKTAGAVLRLLSLPRALLPFMTLLDYTKYALCKDPRDRVYAILGLVSVEVQTEIGPDYGKNAEDVFKDACLCCMKVYRNLEIPTFCEMPYPSAWKYSWVPNLASPKLTRSISYGNASGFADPNFRVAGGSELLFDGVLVGSVSRASTAVPHNATLKELLWIVRG